MHDETNDTIASTDIQAAEPVPASDSDLTGSPDLAAMAAEPVVAGDEPMAASAPLAPAAPMVAMLTGARMPADRGTSSLGLLMQLGGTIGVTVAAAMALFVTFSGALYASGAMFLFSLLCGIRSVLHFMAGTALLYGKEPPRPAVLRYIAASVCQTALCLLIVKNHADGKTLAQLGAIFLGWPLALLVYVSLPHIKALTASAVPDSEDHGFEGAAVLMTVFGIMGTLFAGLMLTLLLDDAELAFSTPASGIIVLVFLALFVRSIVHALGGMKGIGGADFDEANASAARYYNLGIVSAICIGITLFVVIMMSTHSMGSALVMGAFSTSMLLAWPTILRRLYAERNFNVYLAGSDAPTFQRAPDAGLIALGWLLVAMGIFGLGSGLVDALLGDALTAEELRVLALYGDGDVSVRSAWWSVGVSGLELFAGIELVRMSERHKLAAMIYGVVSTVVVLYVIWPAIDSLDGIFADALGSSGPALSRMIAGAAGFQLILGISTIVLVNRVTVPSAVVHVRTNKR